MTGDTEKLVRFLLRHISQDVKMPLGSDRSSWENWMQNVFHPCLKPAVEKAAQATADGLLEELLAVDLSLEVSLQSSEEHCSSASRELGRLILDNLGNPASLRILDRYRSAVEDGSTPGHSAAILGLSAGLFHIAPNVAGTALAYLFWRNTFATDETIDFTLFDAKYVHPPDTKPSQLQAVGG